MKSLLFAFLPLVAFAQPPDIIDTYAGAGPNNVAATDTGLDVPYNTAVGSSGNWYIVDEFENRVYEVNTSSTLTLFAGIGRIDAHSGDGAPHPRQL